MKLKLSLSILAILLAGNFASTAYAATPTPTGITVSPAFQQVTVPQDASQQPVNFSVTNDKSTPQTLDVSVADFNTLNESGGLFFIGSNPTELQKKYGLAQWVSLPTDHITLAAKQTVKLQAQILNLPTLASGGHYGALMLAVDNGKTGTSNNKIGVHAIASSLLFITKQGGDTHKMGLANVYSSHTIFNPPSSITLRFHNDGNTHLIPRGLITITDPSGKAISEGTINENSGILLPQNYRRYPVDLRKIAAPTRIGRYKVTINYRFDGFSSYRTYQSSFLLITPSGLVAPVAAVLVLVGSLYFAFKNKKLSLKNITGRSRR